MEITLTDGIIGLVLSGVVTWAWVLQSKVNEYAVKMAVLNSQLDNNSLNDKNRDDNYKEIIKDLKEIMKRIGMLESKVDLMMSGKSKD